MALHYNYSKASVAAPGQGTRVQLRRQSNEGRYVWIEAETRNAVAAGATALEANAQLESIFPGPISDLQAED